MDRVVTDAWEPCAVLGVSIDPTLGEVEETYTNLKCELLTHGRIEEPMDCATSSSHHTKSKQNDLTGQASVSTGPNVSQTSAGNPSLSTASTDVQISGKLTKIFLPGKQPQTEPAIILPDPDRLRYDYSIWDARPEIWRVDSRNESTSSVPSQVSDASQEGIYDIAGAIYSLCWEHACQMRKPKSNIIRSILQMFRTDKDVKRDRKRTVAVAMQLENLASGARQLSRCRKANLPYDLHRGLVVLYDDLGRDLKTFWKHDVLEKGKIICSYEGRFDELIRTYG